MLNDASRVEFVVEELQNSVTKVLKWDATDFQRKVDEIERLKKDPDRKGLDNHELAFLGLNLAQFGLDVTNLEFALIFSVFQDLIESAVIINDALLCLHKDLVNYNLWCFIIFMVGGH